MGYVSKEWLKEHECQIFMYQKADDGSEGVLPVNIDDLPEADGMSGGIAWKEYLVKLTEKEVSLIRYGLRCAIKQEYRNADIIATASQLKGESTLDCAEDALVQEFFDSADELRKLDHRFDGECTVDG
jgi:hypothetical protein